MTTIDKLVMLAALAFTTTHAAAKTVQAPDQFDLYCTGKITHTISGKRVGNVETWADTFKIDQHAGLYCDGLCKAPNKIEEIMGSTILLRKFSSGNFEYTKIIDLRTMRYLRNEERHYMLLVKTDRTSAKCKLLPFTGLPIGSAESSTQ